MKTTIVNTEEHPASVSKFSPAYEFPHSAEITINELIQAVNYLLEKDRSN